MQMYFSQEGPHRKASAKPGSYQQLIRDSRQHSMYQKSFGVFVTLSRQGHSRACWGSIYPKYTSVEESTVYATLGALTKEYRYKPISATEWPTLKPQVTVIRAIEPIDGLQGQNPLSDGLMVRAGGRSGVILPGEARDAHYQLVQCKVKAGIRPGESYQLYRMVADVYQ
jgi:AMMECR1 domain-containing protein